MGESAKPVKPNRPGMWQRASALISGARLVLLLLSFILDYDGN